MKVARVTVMATIHGLMRGFHAACEVAGCSCVCSGSWEPGKSKVVEAMDEVSIPARRRAIQFLVVIPPGAPGMVQTFRGINSNFRLTVVVLDVYVARHTLIAGLLSEGYSLVSRHYPAHCYQIRRMVGRRKDLRVERRMLPSDLVCLLLSLGFAIIGVSHDMPLVPRS
jgi:hypothetical protein